ncbi:MAG: phosphoribosylformylglycinamidine synthase subunit PurL [Candidatus Micrarchaeota archaeon]
MIVDGFNTDLTKDDLQKVRAALGREPNAVEAGMVDIMWSEHCSYKSSRPVLKMLPTTGPRVVLGPGYDAGVVDIGDGECAAFKIESHNHPSAIEPYSGSATGSGGIIRDILAVGARPIALTDSIFFGKLSSDHSRWLFNYVVKGVGDYGNCVGIPTVAGDTNFDPSFERNCLVNVTCLGLVKRDSIVLGKAKDAGDLVIYVGSSTGRDGIHGVTFASKNLHEKSDEERPAVQIPDPFTKKLIIDATLEALATGKVKAIKDFGGGGLTCCGSELAYKGGKGAVIDASLVPLREKGMLPVEIMLSESQERMLYSCAPKDLGVLEKVFDKYGLRHSVIGKITEEKRFVVTYGGKAIADVPIELLTDAPVVEQASSRPKGLDKALSQKTPELKMSLSEAVFSLFSSDNLAGKAWVFRQYDHEVGARTVVKPGMSGAAVLRISGKKGLAVKTDCNFLHCNLDPHGGSVATMLECARNLACVGAEPIAMTDNLNFGNPNKPEAFWKFSESVRGLSDACKALSVPCIGGNVSFYNEDDVNGLEIKPAPVVGMIGLVDDLATVSTTAFKNAGDAIVVFGTAPRELGGSYYLAELFGAFDGTPPKPGLPEEKRLIDAARNAVRSGLVSASQDVSGGGLAIALAEMCCGGNLGAQLNLESVPAAKGAAKEEILFGEGGGRFVFSTRDPARLLALACDAGVSAAAIGKVTQDKRLVFISADGGKAVDCSVTALCDEHERAIAVKMG